MKIQFQKEGLTVFESALYRTTSTVVRLGNNVLIIDPNWLPNEVDFIADHVANHYTGLAQYLLFTHSDYDHILGYGKFPNATVIASQNFVDQPLKDQIIQQIVDFDNEYYIHRSYPVSYPIVDIAITHDGQTLVLGDHMLTFYLAPGHAKDGMITVIHGHKCCIAGDYLSNIEIPFVDDNYEDYIQTLQKVNDIMKIHHDIQILVVGHGDYAGLRDDISNRIKNDIQYLETLDRNNQIDENNTYEIIKKYSTNPNMMLAHQKNLENIKENNLTK